MPLNEKHPTQQPSIDIAGLHAPQPLGRTDVLLLLLSFVLLMLMSYIRSRGRIFWGDEIMGWEVTRQPTFHRLWEVWSAGNDSSGIWFYVFARPWMTLFGASELTMRMFSAFGMSVSFILTWLCARRYFRWQVVAAVLPLVYLVNRMVVWQYGNGRTYGVLLTAAALCSYALLRTDPKEPDAERAGPLLLTLGGMLLITGSHILGPLYWGVFFAGFLARDIYFRVFRPKIYLAALLGLSVFPVGWRNLRSTMALGKPTYWTEKPHFVDIFSGLDLYVRLTGVVMLVSLLLMLLVWWRTRSSPRPEPLLAPSRASFYFVLGVPLFLILLMFVLSRVSTSIFVDRYLMPVLLFDCLFLCEAISRVWDAAPLVRPVRLAVGGLAVLAVASVYGYDLRHEMALPTRDYTASFLQAIPSGEPIIITDVSHFMDLVFYRSHERQLIIPVDWSVQLDPAFGDGGASPEHELDNWRNAGIHAENIQTTQQALAGKQHFTVVTDEQHTLWVRRYVLNNPAYVARELPSWKGMRIWQVDAR